jgi:hypothetical protein
MREYMDCGTAPIKLAIDNCKMIGAIVGPLPMEKPKKVTAPIKTFIEVRTFQHLPLGGSPKQREIQSPFSEFTKQSQPAR